MRAPLLGLDVYIKLLEARENASDPVVIGFVLYLIGPEGCTNF